MVVKTMPEGAENVIEYEVIGNTLSLNDGDTIINLKKREKDFDVHIDFCFDEYGMLINGVSAGAQKYVAQIDIPARKYNEVTEDNPDFNEDEDESETNHKTITKQVAVLFSMDNVTLTLWELEV